jgi:adenylosuccinate lyase
MHAWETDGDFRRAVESDEKILSYLPIAKIQAAFSLDRHLAHVDQIFARVFGQNSV